MPAIYMTDEDHHRLVNFMLESPLGTILGTDARDMLVIALGEKAGIWPESSRPDDE